MNTSTLPSKVQYWVSSNRVTPWLFLLFLIPSFGLALPSLGIYQDDWLFVYNAHVRGARGLWEFLYADGTPLSSLVNISLFYLLGVKPLYWHVAGIAARWCTVVAFWLVLRELWPDHSRRNFTISLVFAIHPFFVLQPLAFTFLHVWVGYALLGFSFYWMILSVTRPEKTWLYLPLSIVAGAITLVTLEYFAGLELLRPVLLWLVLRDRVTGGRARVVRIAKYVAPFLASLVMYVWWRFFVYVVPIERRNAPIGLEALYRDPLRGMQLILSNLVPDSLSIVVASWFKTLDPSHFDLFTSSNLKFAALILSTAAAAYLLLAHRSSETEDSRGADGTHQNDLLILGLLMVIFGLIPPYVAGLYINEKNPLWNSRFGLASMLGASMVLVHALGVVAKEGRIRYVIPAVLIGLSIGYHARYTNEYRWAWQKQVNFFRQLSLRAPEIMPGTTLMTPEEILSYMGEYPTAYAINALYSNPGTGSNTEADYWYLTIYGNFASRLDDFLGGVPVEVVNRSLHFKGNTRESLILSFEPEQEQCLYLIRPKDAAFRGFTTLLKQSASLSSVDRVVPAGGGPTFLEVIGVDAATDWCSYYERADLARQYRRWDEVLLLWSEARGEGLSPGYYFEYFPFLDAYVNLTQWDRAVELAFLAEGEFPAAMRPLCDYWHALPESAERNQSIDRLELKFSCR